ncbi:hypothetical protein FPZ12_034195 [Amycolatopsis acidicola]|uniref:Uncharacterized protein n=1 Tax=Amycolatopsis acidicola TaxID=2596893 RepID=A0A5N0USC0_9PSEU|nr:hypothetical protein [Amycolatopsis acidicola]KAA9153632.1 hypothetical protein FPZ12_034195 [Amycolatopsis acidicola]
MSVEGAGPRQDADNGSAAEAAGEDKVIPEGRGDVRGISDLTYRIITPYLKDSLVHRCVQVVLVVLAVVCLIATGVRLSPLPLLPIPLFGVAYYALRRMRTASSDRLLVIWASTLLAAVVVGFWFLSVVGTWVS